MIKKTFTILFLILLLINNTYAADEIEKSKSLSKSSSDEILIKLENPYHKTPFSYYVKKNLGVFMFLGIAATLIIFLRYKVDIIFTALSKMSKKNRKKKSSQSTMIWWILGIFGFIIFLSMFGGGGGSGFVSCQLLDSKEYNNLVISCKYQCYKKGQQYQLSQTWK